MTAPSIHIVFAGGGTAGHLFPGLAVAAELATSAAVKITFAGSGKPLEQRLVADSRFDYLALSAAPAPKSARGMFRFIAEYWAGHRQARRFLRQHKVDAVVGLGGYASVPMARAAIAARIPLVLLEQNAFPGKVTRWLAPQADLICSAFATARNHLQGVGPIRVTGNPIRAGFHRRTKRRSSSRSWQHRLVILGGSGGARSLNEQVPMALARLRSQLDGWQLVHQTGSRDAESTRDRYRAFSIEAIVAPFVKNLPSILRSTDLAICRAGGTTLAELAATGVPAILIPYPHAASNHQRLNAEVFVAGGAARMVDGREIRTDLSHALIPKLSELSSQPALRQTMSNAMLGLARPDAAWQVSRMVLEIACRKAISKAA